LYDRSQVILHAVSISVTKAGWKQLAINQTFSHFPKLSLI